MLTRLWCGISTTQKDVVNVPQKDVWSVEVITHRFYVYIDHKNVMNLPHENGSYHTLVRDVLKVPHTCEGCVEIITHIFDVEGITQGCG